MASSFNDGDASKSSNQNSYNNKIFSQSQKNKSRSQKASSNEKTTMENTNGSGSKGLVEKSKNSQSQDKNCSSFASEDGEFPRHCDLMPELDILESYFRTLLEFSASTARIHLRVLRALPELHREWFL